MPVGAVAGHSWGAELALRYAARHPDLVTAVAYVGGVGAGNGFKDDHKAELGRRLGPDRERRAALSAIPDADRTPAEERERCLLQWRTDFSRVTCPVTMISGDDDPRPWTATDSLLAALPDASRTVLGDAGHAPWAKRPADTRSLIIDALRPALPDG